MPNDRPKKLQRISQACDLCHRRSIRCRPSAEEPQQKCQNCFDFGVDCTFQRPSRRRRNKPESRVSPRNITPSHQSLPSPYSPSVSAEAVIQKGHSSARKPNTLGQNNPAYALLQHGTQPHDQVEYAWRSFAAASAQMITECLHVYMDVVYPSLPLFHAPTLWNNIRQARYLEDHGLFASVMAACALAAARSRDGATEPRSQSQANMANLADIFFQAAKDALSTNLDRATSFGYLQACALLASTCVQSGRRLEMHQYLGHYMTLSAIQRFHDESTWPATLSLVDQEERRRLFWSVYSLDIFTSVVFDSPPRCQEAFANVRYPSQADDEALTLGLAQQQSNEVGWLHGWNTVTDLHRILEHAAKRLHWRKHARPSQSVVEQLSGLGSHSDGQAMNHVLGLYSTLPAAFKNLSVFATGDKSHHILGFQVIEIEATFQLVRVMLLDSGQTDEAEQKCDALEHVLSLLRGIARSYLQASSAPLIHRLAAIGQTLESMVQGAVAEDTYQRARALLESLAEFLQELESKLQVVCGASHGIREVVDKLDQHMLSQRQLLSTASAVQMPAQSMQIQTHPKKGPYSANMIIRQVPKVREARTPLDEFQFQRGIAGEWTWPFDFSQEPDGSALSG